MRTRLLPLVCLFLFLYPPLLQAQTPVACGFDKAHAYMLQTNPAYRKAVQQYELSYNNYLKNRPAARQDAAIIMPVVIHIMHTGGALGTQYNPTDAQIQTMIAYLNQVYAGTYPGLEGVKDLGVQFALAQRDPNCNPTNGIEHINASSITGYTAAGVNSPGSTGGTGTDEVTLKNFARWDPTRYCNVWVVNMIDGIDGFQGGGTGGFAYFPFTASIDGVVIRSHEIQVGNTTLPHEMGHTFTLYHPFEGANGAVCPPNANPNTDGDMIADTDPVTNPNFANPERTGTNNPCTNTPYTINTEHNIMSYVFNPTLFTANQKTRLQAGAADPNRVNQENSLGNIATNLGSSTCPPKIDFELANYQMREMTTSSSSTSGCTRNYTDYTFNLLIGNNPSAPTTATLSVVSGTATEGVDFDITTNGSFSSPSKAISFPTGTNAAKSFTVRIYDDAIVESTETFTLGFTVNNGGGNVQAGDGRTNLVLTIFDNDSAPYAAVNTSYTLNGTFNFSAAVPLSGTASQFKSQQLYKASELTAAGVSAGSLAGLSLNVTKATAAAFKYKGFTIRLGQTTQAYLRDYTDGIGAPIADAGLTTVYSADYATVSGINTFTFTTPFTWDGTSNIVVNICYDNGGVTDPNNDALNFYSDDYSGTNSAFVYQYTNCSTTFNGYTYYNNDYKPVISFIRHDPGTPVQSTLNASKTEYLGPNADVYFYDQTQGSLMARVRNLSSFNYGCTQVVIDRAGTGSSQFWNHTTANYLLNKTFHVIPTTNNAAGQYEITLFYTPAEVSGWQTATGQTFSNIQLVKVPGQISSVTPASPNGAGTALVITPARGALGANYTLDYTFNNGFSGFGAGIPGASSLPVKLLDFTGQLQSNAITLYWTTTAEINSKLFGIERSYDGSSFSSIGSVAAAGQSSGTISYSYPDRDIAQSLNYYRLKMTDIDGNFDYSNVVLVKAPINANLSFTVLSNPVSSNLDLQFGKVSNSNTEIRLLDITGRILQRWTAQAGSRLRLALNSGISTGVYTVQVIQDGSQYTKKVIKE